jgi:type I restriction enzyme S subunit
MGSEWAFRSLGECAELVKDSFRPDEEMDVPYIGLEHIAENSLRLLGWGSSKDVVSVKSRFRKGDILFGKLRPYFRKVIRAPFDGVCSTDIWVIRPKLGIDAGFLFYWVASQEFVDKAMAGAEGTKMPRAKWDFVTRIQKQIPPLPEQRAIAHILGTLDDQIETLRRMNETLEGIARALFKAWFVDFEPVRAKMSGRWQRGQSLPGLPADLYDLFPDTLIPSELGQIPQGWRVKPVGEVVNIFDSLRVPLSNREREKRKGKYPYYGATSIMDYVDDYLFDGVYVLMGEDGSVIDDKGFPVLQYVWGKFWANNHAHVLQGNGISTEHLLLFLEQTRIRPYVTGAVQPKINQTNLKRIPFLWSSFEINKKFTDVIQPFFGSIRQNTEQSRTLAALRDALLPELISGRLRLADAERFLQARGL